MKHSWFVFANIVSFVLCIEHDFKGFDDSILFALNWPGRPESAENLVEGETIEPQVQFSYIYN